MIYSRKLGHHSVIVLNKYIFLYFLYRIQQTSNIKIYVSGECLREITAQPALCVATVVAVAGAKAEHGAWHMTRIVRYQADVLVVDLVDGAAGLGATDARIRDRRPFGAAPVLIVVGEVAQGAARQRLIALAEAWPRERLVATVTCNAKREE